MSLYSVFFPVHRLYRTLVPVLYHLLYLSLPRLYLISPVCLTVSWTVRTLFSEFGASPLPPFEFALRAAETYLDRDFVRLAGAAARERFAQEPKSRPDPARIARDLEEYRRFGLRALVASRSDALKPRTYQPSFVLPPDRFFWRSDGARVPAAARAPRRSACARA